MGSEAAVLVATPLGSLSRGARIATAVITALKNTVATIGSCWRPCSAAAAEGNISPSWEVPPRPS